MRGHEPTPGTDGSRAITARHRRAGRRDPQAARRRIRSARGSGRRRLVSALAAVAVTVGMVSVLPAAPAAAAATSTLDVSVTSARTEPRALGGTGVTKGDAIADFNYIVNIDETGTTDQRSAAPGSGCSALDPGYPSSCRWQSIAEPSGWAPIYTQGTQDDFPLAGLPDGRYLISITADGYKIDGAHFCVDTGAADVAGCASPLSGPLTVELQPNPLPDGTLRAQVFEDNAPTNMGYDTSEATMAGFVGHIVDTLGEIQTDVYGNPLCTRYEGEDPDTYEIPLSALDADMLPIPIPGSGGTCVSDATGMLAIPHLGSNRYAVSVTPPDGPTTWIQTTTLEGNHDYDAWIMEGDTGYSTIFTHGGEPTPDPIFGFVKATNTLSGGSGHITGSVVAIKTYTPPKGGSYDFWGGNTGTKVGGPIDRPWLSLSDLQAGDAAVWIGRGNADGTFDISGVPDGDYTLSWWDEPQDYNLNMMNVTVRNGSTESLGQLPLNGWWTEYSGFVFNDANRNGKKDTGEAGIPDFTLTLRHRENNLYDRGQNTAVTDSTGHYYFESGYPIGEWTVLEAYNDSFYTTGVTYQADNQPSPTTVKGAGVDLSVMPIIGLSGTVDWGVHAYDRNGTSGGVDPRNGGIVGTVSYDTTRNELNPQYAVSEDWQPGVSGVPVELYDTVPCGTNAGRACDSSDRYELATDGSYAKGKLLNTYVTESWQRPTGCTARDVDGNPLVHAKDNPTAYDENVLVPTQETTGECISSFMQGIQFAPYPTDQGTSDANFGAAVNGNYGFGDGCFTGTLTATDPADPVCTGGAGFEALPGGRDYLVHVAVPQDAQHRPLYHVTGEEDINIGNGDQIVPQVPPPACAGALHTVDVQDNTNTPTTDGYPAVIGDGTNGAPTGVTVPASTPVHNATFVDIGGSPFEGMPKPQCDTKLVTVNNGKSIVPMFNVFTDVPVPSRMRTVIIDDINFSNDPRSIMYGEKAGLAFAPVGIYDFANKLEYTTETDFNGIYDVLMPSTNHISCPTPSGVCGNLYRFVANDPGIPGRLNPNYKANFATQNAGAEGLPGISTFADLAPTQVGLQIESPSTGLTQVTCPQSATSPQLMTVSKPYVNGSGAFSINGIGFGATKGTGTVTLDGTALPTGTWTDTAIGVTVPAGTPVGPHQLKVTAANGQSTVNGLTFHVLGTGYNPALREVGPGHTYASIQDALDASLTNNGDDLVVVYPGTPDLANPRNNPRGAYYENLVMASPVKLQGVGPGGFQGSTYLPGSIIDASAYGGDTAAATDWFNRVGALAWDGNQTVNDGEAIYLVASQNATTAAGRARQFTSSFKASIDGFDIRGGSQNGFPGNINDLTGGATGLPPTIETQGGAIFANAYVRNLQVTNNVVQNNGSSYGTIRVGTPDLPAPDTNQHNEDVRIANNRIVQNAGTNLAGGIGLFAGSDRYQVSQNDICGNFSLEYGGGLSVYGLSPAGSIDHNRIYFNNSNDEGGGIMIAGELPVIAGTLSPGTGAVDIFANQIQGNLANDDGGGIRFLMSGNFPMNVHDNMIVNNVSTHEGGGIAIDDAPNVRVYDNTVMKNLTTATAVTSDGTPAPAGISTAGNSDQLQVTLPVGSPTFSNPLLFDNIFWDNRAGTRAGRTVTGLGLAGDASAVNHWDLGVSGDSGLLAPTNSVLQQNLAGPSHPYTASATNVLADPQVVGVYDVSVTFATWRQNPAFVDSTLVAVEAPPDLLGNYHLGACPGSPACNLGASSKAVPAYQAPPTSLPASALDIDGQARPALGGFDAGADEFGGSVPPPPPPPSTADIYYSTAGNTNPPGVGGTADDADIYHWNGTTHSRTTNMSDLLVPSAANVDGYAQVDATHFYVSFSSDTTLPGLGAVQDEDVVYRDGSTWRLYFDGTAHGLGTSANLDIDALSIVGGVLYFSTAGNTNPPGVGGTADDADIYRWNGSTYARVVNASDLGIPGSANVDGLQWVDSTHWYLSFSGDVTVTGLGAVQDEDVVNRSGSTWSVYFDGTAHGLGASANLDIDAFSLPGGATAPPATTLFVTPTSALSLPGITGSVANDDVVGFDGSSYWVLFDGSDVLPSTVASAARVNAFSVIDSSTLLLTFDRTVTLPGLGTVTPSDIVKFTGTLGPATSGSFSWYFDGSDVGLTTTAEAITGLDRLGDGSLVVSTAGGIGVTGIASGDTTGSDVFRFVPTALGATTSGSWQWYLDGSDVGLGGGSLLNQVAERIGGVAVGPGGDLLLTTFGPFSVTGVSGTNRDVFVCGSVQTGANTTCTWSSTKYFTGSSHGFTSILNPLAGIDLP